MTGSTQRFTFARTDRSALGQWWWTIDRWLLGATLVLVTLGILLSFGNSPAAASRMHVSDPFHFAIRQTVFGFGAATLMILVSMLNPKLIRRTAFYCYLASIAVMFALVFIGHEAKGATRWLEFGGFTLQPSEFMKPALIVLAAWMFAEGQKGQGVPGVSIAFAIYALAVVLLLKQPDVGQTVLITMAFGACFFMAGVPIRWILGLGAVAIVGGISLYFTLDHVAARVDKFLDPDRADTTQIDHAQAAISAGGVFGKGVGEGVLKRQVPDVHTDFAYSGAAEELGLVFSLFLISLFAFVVIRGMMRAVKLTDPFEQVAAAGLFVLVGQQAFINIAVNLNLIPTKGMTLPFISYGGSSMLAMGLTLGMALALTRRRPGAYAQTEAVAPSGAFT
ncbi:MAG: putative lipid II flippase FtsW [Alphaproteobacteria bacterium]